MRNHVRAVKNFASVLLSVLLIVACMPISVSASGSTAKEKEPNDSAKKANVVSVGTKISGALSTKADKDMYKFSLAADKCVCVDFSVSAASSKPAWGVTLLDKDMHELSYKTFSSGGKTDKIALDAGEYYIEITAVNHSKADYGVCVEFQSGAAVERLGGSSRIDTAIMISKAGWNGGTANTVVIANAFNYPDALAGVPLAAAYNAPILLTRGEGGIENSVIKEIKRLGAKNVYLLGGTAAISTDAEKELKKNVSSVTRVSGSDRYATAVKIAEKVKEKNGKVSTIYFASALNFPDALSVSPVAALSGGVVLYMPKNGSVNAVTSEFVKNCGCKNAVVIGGSAAVSDEGLSSIKALGLSTERVYGSSRYDTSVKICEKYSKLFKGSGAALATGENFPDALAGGVLAAKKGVPVVLVHSPMLSGTNKYLSSLGASKLYVFGGEGAVPSSLTAPLAK